jgi:hypothetical protein
MFDSRGHRFASSGLCTRDYDVRMCGGREIDISGRQAEQSVAHGAPDDARFFAVAVQYIEKIQKPAALKERRNRAVWIDVHSK